MRVVLRMAMIMMMTGGGNKCDDDDNEDASGGGNDGHSNGDDYRVSSDHIFLTPNCCFRSHIGETRRHYPLCLILCV